MNMNAFLQALGINPAWLPLYLLVLFLGVAALLAWVGGWRDLARRFPSAGKSQGETWHFRTIGIRKWRVPTNYSNCVHVSIGAEGIGLAMSFFFRFQHDPIFIPWHEIELVERKQHWFGGVTTLCLRSSSIRIHLPGKAGAQAMQRWNQRQGAGLRDNGAPSS